MVNDETANDIRRVRELIKKIGFAMLVTRDGDRLRARPMSACLDRDTNAILVLTDARRHKVSM
jgi:general stress protein 26